MTAKTNCTTCGAEILYTTAVRFGGLCAPCANGTRAQINAARRRASEPTQPRPQPQAVTPTVTAITNALDTITDPESASDLALLMGALDAVPHVPGNGDCVPALLRVFERFPWADGFESFWGILHTLEKLPGYEPHLLASVLRTPGQFNLLMVNRLLNAGICDVDGLSLLGILDEVANSSRYPDRARSQARSFKDHQRGSRGPG
jgi:hypothetical protein